MAKYFGKIGFYKGTEETAPDVYEEQFDERVYPGDVTRNIQRWQNAPGLNDDIVFNNVISILADPFAFKHIGTIRYIELYGTKWRVTSAETQYPRLILNVGGVYNGTEQVGTAG